MTTDQDAAIDFYRSVVGWNVSDHPNSTASGMRYVVLSAGDRGIGGIFGLNDEMIANGARPGWVGYIGTADTDAKTKEVVAAGGKLLMGPDDIPNVGRFSMVADPGGAPFYLLTPQGEATPPLDPLTTGLVSWRELYTSVGEKAAFAFYSGLFGWETLTEMPMGEMGSYRIFGVDGEQTGGMMDKPANVPASSWAFYVYVDGIDAAVERVKAKGGQVTLQPTEVPGGSWVIQGIDPQGAAFALVSVTR
jgi:predicted enzyme related to lactoylglutathione lyase